jgi:hypothetical protein
MTYDVHEEAPLSVPFDYVAVILYVFYFEVYLALVDAEGAHSTMAVKWTVIFRCGRHMVSGDTVESPVDVVGDRASDHDIANLPF